MAAEYVFAVNPTLDAEGNQVKIGYTKTPNVDGEGNPVLDANGNPTYTESFSHGGKWGVYNGNGKSNFSFGGLQICHFVLTDNPYGASMEDRVFYAPGPWEGGWTTTDDKGNDQRRYESTKLFGTASGWNTDIITLGFNRDVTEREDYDQADFAILINGAQKTATSNVKHPNSATQCKFYTIQQLNSWTANGAAGTAADAFFGVPATVYAIRVYDRALTDAERAQNYAVDLLAYFEIDVTGIETLSLDEQAALVNELSRFSMNKGGKSEIQAIVSNAVAKVVPTAADMSAYDELYVTEDLVALFTAFDAKGSGIDLAAGTWTDKKSGLTVTLDDRTGAAEWNLGQNGMGVGYWFQSLKDLAGSRYTIGMRLPTSVLTDGDLAVEYTYKPNPVENPDGTQEQILKISGTQQTGIETTIGRHTYGLYNGDNSSFTFAGLQLCQFQWDNYDGASMTARAFYSNGSWGAMNSGDFAQPYLFGTKADGYSSDVAVLSIDRTVTEKTGEGEYNEASFVVYKNGVAATTVKNGGAHAKQKDFYTIEELNASHSGSTAADAFYGVPATVYAIRIYTDDLTAAEKAQNYAVDLMAYFGMDVGGFAAVDADVKTLVYEVFAQYTFNATEDDVAVMQAVLDTATAGVPVAEGFQISNSGEALRIWASVDGLEEIAKLGMTITFKQDGEVIYTGSGETTTAFLSVTAGDTTITAESLGAEALYAASVTGYAAGTYTVEVTPYAVLKNGTTMTGTTESATVTFTFAE